MEAQQIPCSDCGSVFTHDVGEQIFFQQKGFVGPPKRCPACRRPRRSLRTKHEQHVGDGR
jgi:hypothetical protein